MKKQYGQMIVGVIGILAVTASMAKSKQVSFLEGYKLFSSSGNYLNGWFTGHIYLFISLLAAGILGILLLTAGKKSTPGQLKKLFVTLGDKSYLLYLFHWPILVVIKRLFFSTWYLLLPSVFTVSVAALWVYELLYGAVRRRCLGGRDI